MPTPFLLSQVILLMVFLYIIPNLTFLLPENQAINDVFEPADVKWRGFPVIPGSGLKLRDKFEEYDARKKFEDELAGLKDKEFTEPKGCRCGEVLRGVITPLECPLFGKICSPEDPKGACMVSTEGTCAAYYKYN